jgi:hypothetical protein
LQTLKKTESKLDYYKYQGIVNLELAVQGTQLSKIKKEDEASLHIALKNLIVNLVESLNLTQTVNESQIIEMVFLLSDKYWFVKLEELVLVFKKAKLGEYGKIYNRLDVQIISEWIDSFLKSEERALYFERLNAGFKSDPIPKELMEKAYKNFQMPKEKEDKDEQYQRDKAEYFRQKKLREEKQNENDKNT